MDGARNEEGIKQQQDLEQRAQPPEAAAHSHEPSPPPARCPRCDSSNTKFCYYNNYSLSQPRYFCKACRRYWTHGGTLRNVPVGGGCRKSKRPRISSLSPSSSLSSNGLISRPQCAAPAAAARPQNPSAVIMRPPPPLGGGFYGGGSFLSSLAVMQSGGINQGAAVMGGGGRFGSNMALLHEMMKSPAPAPAHFFPSQQNLIQPGSSRSWTQSVINAGASSSSAASAAGMWSSGGDREGSSFAANQWSDCSPGFKPSE